MGQACRAFLVLWMGIVAWSGVAAAIEPQKAAGAARQAKLYFLREDGHCCFGAAPRIKIDGQLIDTLSSGSYVVVERPVGKHTLRVEPPVPLGYFETDVELGAGTYYFEVGPDQSMRITAMFLSAANNVGRPMPGRRFNSAWQFNAMDTKTGAAEIAKLKPQ